MDTKKRRLAGEDRKELILNVACRLFAEIGYDKTSTKELAKAVNCSEALLYKYFDSKKAIMEYLLDEWTRQQNRKIKIDIVNNSALETLRMHYVSFLSLEEKKDESVLLGEKLIEALNSTPYYRQKAWEAFMNGSDMVQDTILPIIQCGQKQGEIKEGDAFTLANVFVSYIVGAREIKNNFPHKFAPIPFETLVKTLFI